MSRTRSKGKDQNDQDALMHGKYKNMGASVSSEYYQIVPFFFTAEGATLNFVGQYRGGTAFLIAGGPSFAGVKKKYLNSPGVWTMTINNAIKSFRGNAAIMVDEPSRFTYSMWMDPAVQKFAPFTSKDKPLWDNRLIRNANGEKVQLWQPSSVNVGDCPNVSFYRRNERFEQNRFLYEDTINWGCHKNFGGGRSVMLASLRVLFLLGFREVYLLGVDFNMDENAKYHFEEARTQGAIKGNNNTYKKMMKWFEDLQPRFLAEGFKIYNCNPESNLEAFPFVPYNDAIRNATSKIGDAKNERVAGLYSKHSEKMQAYNISRGRAVPPSPQQIPNGGNKKAPLPPVNSMSQVAIQGDPVPSKGAQRPLPPAPPPIPSVMRKAPLPPE